MQTEMKEYIFNQLVDLASDSPLLDMCGFKMFVDIMEKTNCKNYPLLSINAHRQLSACFHVAENGVMSVLSLTFESLNQNVVAVMRFCEERKIHHERFSFRIEELCGEYRNIIDKFLN